MTIVIIVHHNIQINQRQYRLAKFPTQLYEKLKKCNPSVIYKIGYIILTSNSLQQYLIGIILCEGVINLTFKKTLCEP